MYLSIDIGKSNTRVASSRDLKSIVDITKFATSSDLTEQKKNIKESVFKVSGGEPIQSAVLGVPGIINRFSGSFFKMNLYPQLNGLAYESFLQDCLEYKEVFVENDALLAGYGEAVGGSGKEFDIVCYLTLSTGVGGCRIAHKSADPSYYFQEPGHQIILEGGRECPVCGQKGCLQAYTSGQAFEEIYKMKPEDCSDDAIWDDYAKHLACGINNLIAMWSPEIIVIGGGLSQKFDFIYASLIEQMSKMTFFPVPEIRKSAFGDESGIRGGFFAISKIIEK